MRNKILFLYYAILTIILVMWGNPEMLPPIHLRMLFLVLVVTPLFTIARDNFLVIFFFFVILSGSNHAVSYMPATGPSLIICALVGALFFKPIHSTRIQTSVSLYLLFFFSLCVDLIAGGKIENFSYALLLLIIVANSYMSLDRQKQTQQITYSFIILSLILSIEFFIWGSQFSNTIIVGDEDFERLGWSDPNYFSCVIGFGALISFRELLEHKIIEKNKNWLLLITLLLSLFVIISTASRGASVALVISIILATFFSRMSFVKKIGIMLLGGVLIIMTYRVGFFDLLINRVVYDDGAAGGRTIIWSTKLKVFFSSNPLNILFGYGIKEGRILGFTTTQGFHNDYLAFLVCYGIVGFLLFMSFIITPVLSKGNRHIVIPYLAYMLTICLSLEPISSGNLIYFYFFLFILLQKRLPVGHDL